MPFDPGLLGEALLFYQSVHVLLDHGSLTDALIRIGPDVLLRLLQEDWVKATYSPSMFAISSTDFASHSVHGFTQFQFAGFKNPKFERPQDSVLEIFDRTLGKSWGTRRAANKFLNTVSFKKTLATSLHKEGIPGLAIEDIHDPHYVRDVIEIALKNKAPDYKLPPGWFFKIIFIGEKQEFVIDTNLNLSDINDVHRRYFANSELTFPRLIGEVLEARADLTFSADYMAEYVTSTSQAQIMQRKIADLLRRRTQSQTEIRAFQELVFQDGAALGDAIRSGDRSLSDFLNVLEKGHKFRKWLGNANPDEGLIREYFRAATGTSWISTLPVKLFRFAVFTASGMLGDAASSSFVPSVALGAADSFLFERLFGGWKPHQFINKHVKPFVDGGP